MANFVQPAPAVDADSVASVAKKRSVCAVVRPHCRRLVKMIDAVAQKKRDVENVHRLRTESRRINAAIKLFRDWLPKDIAEDVRKQIRKIRRKAGPVRDLDVLILNLQEMTDLLPDQDIGQVVGRAENLRKKQAKLLATQCRKLLRSGIEHDLKMMLKQIHHSEKEFAASTLNQSPGLKEVSDEFESAIPYLDGDNDQMHGVRKAARHLRFTLELINQLNSDPRIDDLCEQLTRLQDTLGDFNDRAYLLEFLGNCEHAIDHQTVADALRHAIHFLEARIPEQKKSIVVETMDDSRSVVNMLNGQ